MYTHSMRRSDIRCCRIIIISASILTLYLVAHGGFPRPHAVEVFNDTAKDLLLNDYLVKNMPGCDNVIPDVYLTVIVRANLAEDISTLTQTVASIMTHTNPHILDRIYVLIDETVGAAHVNVLYDQLAVFKSIVKVIELNTVHSLRRILEIGAKNSKGNVVLFLTDEVILAPGYLNALAKLLHDHPKVSRSYHSDLSQS